jgi:hypothetical protein
MVAARSSPAQLRRNFNPTPGIAAGVLGAGVPVALAAAGVIAPLGAIAAIPIVAAIAGLTLLRRRCVLASNVLKASIEEDLSARVERIESEIVGKVPPAVHARVSRIASIVDDTVPRLSQLGPGSAQAHAVVATATNYLPEALGAYLRLPRSYADRRPVANGKTSLMVLCDQLDLLAAKMDEVLVAVCRSDVDALVAHGRFLDEKFGSGALAIERHVR